MYAFFYANTHDSEKGVGFGDRIARPRCEFVQIHYRFNARFHLPINSGICCSTFLNRQNVFSNTFLNLLQHLSGRSWIRSPNMHIYICIQIYILV